MKVFYLEVTNIITTRAIKRLLHHQGIPASTKLTEAQDKLDFIPTPIGVINLIDNCIRLVTSHE